MLIFKCPMISFGRILIPLWFVLAAALYASPQPAEGPEDEQAVVLSLDEGRPHDTVQVPVLLSGAPTQPDQGVCLVPQRPAVLPDLARLVEQRSLSPPAA